MLSNPVAPCATAEDRDYARRHAFEYADSYTTTDEAVRYADHYVGLIASEDDMSYWPGHRQTFADWRAAENTP